jgi:hypothetical protein
VRLDGAREFDAVIQSLSLLQTNFFQQTLDMRISPLRLSEQTCIPVTVMAVMVMAALTMLVI